MFKDPELFQGDLLTDFISSKLFDPVGYQAIYRLGVQLSDPLPFSQWLTLFLLLISVWLLFELTALLIPNMSGRLFCCAIFLFFSLYDTSGGLPRSFAFPLLLGFLYLVARGAFMGALLTIWLQAVLYPPMLLNSTAIAAWEHVKGFIRGRRDRRWFAQSLFAVVVLGSAAVFLWLVYNGAEGGGFGGRISLQEASGMAEFYHGGRTLFFRPGLLGYLFLGRSGIGIIYLIGLWIIFVAVALLPGIRGMRIPTLFWNLVFTSLILFGLAHLLLFHLHLPSRYTHYTLPLAFMLAIGANTDRFLNGFLLPKIRGLLGADLWAHRRALGWGLLVLILLPYGWLQGNYISRVDPLLVVLDREDMEMLGYLKGLPKDVLIAGHPWDMDNVPLIAQRKVLANREMSIPYYSGYYRRVRKRIIEMLEAYYAGEIKEVVDFSRRYGVQVFVVRKDRLSPNGLERPIYHEPFNSEIRARFKSIATHRFALADPPREWRCFENSKYIVLCLDSRKKAQENDGREEVHR
jgi:hypothetical protein